MTDERSLAENARLARKFATALSDGDVAALVGMLSPEAIWHFPGHGHVLAGGS